MADFSDLSIPLPLNSMECEICNGFLTPERAGQFSRSFDHDGVHFVIFDTVRFFTPTEEHPQNWYFIADPQNLEWLATDLASARRRK